jgi:hypothetical protein
MPRARYRTGAHTALHRQSGDGLTFLQLTSSSTARKARIAAAVGDQRVTVVPGVSVKNRCGRFSLVTSDLNVPLQRGTLRGRVRVG